tara:strand:- start:2818 stop:3633 length:816 start_codon:yes stop_codon:yes gene_type:complete
MRSFILFFCLYPFALVAQDAESFFEKHQKGELFFYWGWNGASFSKSDIHLRGVSYNFTLEQVEAHDRQTPFNSYDYFHPKRITIPQYNARVGYFIKDNVSISIGSDHMKYVADSNQVVAIHGYIHDSGTIFDGIYQGEEIPLSTDLLRLEHTDGLNYINVECRNTVSMASFRYGSLSFTKGFGAGIMIPKTNASFLNHSRHDDFHIAGYGFNTLIALHVNFGKHFFFESECKAGFSNLVDIRITNDSLDRAKQDFYFLQTNIVFGVRMYLK